MTTKAQRINAIARLDRDRADREARQRRTYLTQADRDKQAWEAAGRSPEARRAYLARLATERDAKERADLEFRLIVTKAAAEVKRRTGADLAEAANQWEAAHPGRSFTGLVAGIRAYGRARRIDEAAHLANVVTACVRASADGILRRG